MIRLFVIFIFLIGSSKVEGQNAQSKFMEAQQAYESGKYADAFNRIEEIEMMLGGTNAKIQSLKAEIYYEQGDLENAELEVSVYFKVVPYAMQGTEGYNAMLDLQKELSSAIETKFNKQTKDIEQQQQNELAALDKGLTGEQEEFYYSLVKNCEYPQAIRDFITKYPNSVYRSSLELKIASLGNDIDQQVNPDKYLMEALKKRNQALVDKLLSNGCNVNVKDPSGKYPIHITVENADFGNLKKLYYAGADINVMDINGRTPVSLAIEKEQNELIDFLVNAGADLNKADNANESPLFYAIRTNSTDLVQKLIIYNAELTTKNTRGVTPLVTAIMQKNIDVEIVLSLLHQGVYVNKRVNNDPPLYYAVNGNKNQLAEILLQYNADPAIKSSQGFTMLYLAFLNKNNSLAEILLKGKADPNQFSDNHFAPLHFTVLKKQYNACELLLRYGALVNQRGPYGWTPLHFASREQSDDVVRLLLTHNADKKIKDEWGRTPRKIAREHHFKTIKKLL